MMIRRFFIPILMLSPAVLQAQSISREQAQPAYTTNPAPRVVQPSLAMDPASVQERVRTSGGSLLQISTPPARRGGGQSVQFLRCSASDTQDDPEA